MCMGKKYEYDTKHSYIGKYMCMGRPCVCGMAHITYEVLPLFYKIIYHMWLVTIRMSNSLGYNVTSKLLVFDGENDHRSRKINLNKLLYFPTKTRHLL